MSERRQRSISQAFIQELLVRQLGDHVPDPSSATIVDVGGGTGIVATALAAIGYRVTVVDPSPDALASLERRSQDGRVADLVTGLQGDASDLERLIGSGQADAVVCHRVLEVVDAPAAALAAMAAALRPGGVLSLVVAQRHAAVLSQGLAGHFAAARSVARDTRRFTYVGVLDLLDEAGFTVMASHGVGVVADHVAEALVDSSPGAYAELLALEFELSQDPIFRAVAPHLHVLAVRPAL